jgi:hypothetical protein
MVGSMIEERISADLKKAYDDTMTFTNKYLKENSL